MVIDYRVGHWKGILQQILQSIYNKTFVLMNKNGIWNAEVKG
jgi:hypothetical protein